MTRGKAGCYSRRIIPYVPPTPAIATQPQNNYSADSSEAAAFSVVAWGDPDTTYQWQAYLSSSWQNIYGKTAASVTITPSDYYSSDTYIPVRCVVTTPTTTIESHVVHHAMYHQANYASGIYAYVYGSSSLLTPSSSVTVNGESFLDLVLNSTANEGFGVSAGAMGSGTGDYSWFSGNDFLFSIDESTDASTWSGFGSGGARQYPSFSPSYYPTGQAAGTTRYYRLYATRPWPLTVVDDSQSASRSAVSGVLLRWRASWT